MATTNGKKRKPTQDEQAKANAVFGAMVAALAQERTREGLEIDDEWLEGAVEEADTVAAMTLDALARVDLEG